MKRILIGMLAIATAQCLSGCASMDASRDPAGGQGSGRVAGHGGGSATPRPASATPPKAERPVATGGSHTHGTIAAPHPDKPVADHPGHADHNPQPVVHNGNNGKDEHHPVITDSHPVHVVDHDPRTRIVDTNFFRHDFQPRYHWDHFYPDHGWAVVWGIDPNEGWGTVGTVTCEAVNETTQELFPVTMDRDGRIRTWAWNDVMVNQILAEALEECAASAALAIPPVDPTTVCIAATPACSFQPWVWTAD